MNMSNNILNNSKLSIGLYQGPDNDEVDQYLFDVIEHAFKIGINNFDVAPNYRNTRSELVLGRILKKSKSENIFISTKGGFVPCAGQNKNIIEFGLANKKSKIYGPTKV